MSFVLHPGCIVALARLTMDELGVARAIAAGDLTSPQKYDNVWLFDIRITGTGTSYRKTGDEYCYRPPEEYLTPDFLARCNGLPVIMEHPDAAKLNSKEFSDRVIGTVFVPYIKGDEVWAVAKIFDAASAEMMESQQLSTSPAVYFHDFSVNETTHLEDGKKLLIEGKPSLLDHIAIVTLGVWDKGGPPTGVTSTTIGEEHMAEKTEAEGTKDSARKDGDAQPAMLDKMLMHLENIGGRLDALCGRMDGYDASMMDKAKKDAEEKAKAEKDSEDEKETEKAEEKIADEAEEETAKESAVKDKAKKDAEEMEKMRKDNEELRSRMDALDSRTRDRSDDESGALAEAQARADSVAVLFGEQARRPMAGETLLAYRKSMAKRFQQHDASWKAINLNVLADEAFGIAENSILQSARLAATNPTSIPAGQLRQVVRHSGGHEIREYFGEPKSWMDDLAGHTKQCVTKINSNLGGRN